MKITDFLSPANAIVETRSLDKAELLGELCERAARELGLDPRPVISAIAAREALVRPASGAVSPSRTRVCPGSSDASACLPG